MLNADLEGECENSSIGCRSDTAKKRYICFVDFGWKKIVIVELTIPFETNFRQDDDRKLDRYAGLIHGISEAV